MQDLSALIVGAGVAGLSCAGLLADRGITADIVERSPEDTFNTSGYMLGMLPLGGRVLNALDARKAYFERSIQMEQYEIHHPDGKLVKDYPLGFINKQYGSYRGITRMNLVDILVQRAGKSRIRFNTTVPGLDRHESHTRVTFSDGSETDYDVVIIADGLHSKTRDLLLRPSEYTYKDTGWGGWVTWLDEEPAPAYKEYWGNGSFLGLYPVKGKYGIFLGGPVDRIRSRGLANFKSDVQDHMSAGYELPNRALDAFDEAEDPFFWEFHDCRSHTWFKDNVILLGDAATGFLPTAGVGASMAMDSAAALADELSRADRKHIQYALKLYTQQQKERVEKAQKDSRHLGKMMFINSAVISKLRDELLPFYSLQRMLSELTKVMEGQ